MLHNDLLRWVSVRASLAAWWERPVRSRVPEGVGPPVGGSFWPPVALRQALSSVSAHGHLIVPTPVHPWPASSSLFEFWLLRPKAKDINCAAQDSGKSPQGIVA